MEENKTIGCKSNGFKYGTDIHGAVNAIYTPPTLSVDNGNVFIEALPDELSKDELLQYYHIPFSCEPSKDASEEIQLAEAGMLRNMRLPLPFSLKVDKQFHTALIQSLRARRNTLLNNPVAVIYDDEKVDQPMSFRAAGGADTGIGLTLLGVGGCGKSEAIETLLRRYPQVIIHEHDNKRFIQIVWIRVVTPANANLKDLYMTIARAIDEALGNVSGFYTSLIRKEKSVGMMADFLARLVRSFAIGAIILDEVQNLDSHRTKESSLDSLMTLINTTKVSLVLVGTNDALSLFYKKYYIARRTGSIIYASEYCSDKTRLNIIIKSITEINWFKEPFTCSDEIVDAIIEETGGIIDRIISLWVTVQTTYITSKVKPEITASYIHDVAFRDNPFMGTYSKLAVSDMRQSMGYDEPDPELSGEMNLLAIQKAKEDGFLDKHIAGMSNPAKVIAVYDMVVNHITLAGQVYSRKRILATIEKVMKLKSSKNADVVKLSQKVIKQLSKETSDKRSKQGEKKEFDMDKFTNLLSD